MTALSDSELYRVFDICYDYDVYGDFMAYVDGRIPLAAYVEALNRQESIYPADYVKLRFLENHDRVRAAFLFPDRAVRENWLAWMFFQKGIALLYSGQEWAPAHRPTLFDADPVRCCGEPVDAPLIRTLAAMKKDPLFSDGIYTVEAKPNDVLAATWTLGKRKTVGIFSLKGKSSVLPVPLAEGTYRNLLGDPVAVEYGMVSTCGAPMILMTD